jgi:hypothetical protein
MKRAMNLLTSGLALALAAFVFQQASLAQVDPWDRVKLIEPGKKVQIRLHSGKTVNGRVETWKPDSVSVRQGDKTSTISKSDITQVALVTGMSRKRKAAYAGLITGGVVGGLTGAAFASACCEDQAIGIAAAAAVFWGGVAAGIAALFPQPKEVIYTAVPEAAAAGRTGDSVRPASVGDQRLSE